jgi:hypothetical protein
MALTFSVVDTWDDGKRIHVSGTVATTGNYSTSGDTLDLSQVPLIASAALGAWTLGAPVSRDMEQFTNVLAERVSYQVGTNAVGAWFALTKLVPWAKPDPFAVVRGTH